MRNPRLLGVLVCAVMLAACAAPQTQRLLESRPAALPSQALVEDVPFFPQQEYYCGPAALAMVLNHHGRDITQEQLAAAVYVPERKGSLQVEMLGAARRQGMPAYVLPERLQSLLAEIAAGHPVVVLQNLGVSWYPVWHYAVAIGYDLDRRELILHSGENPGYRVSLDTFERTWARAQRWAVAILPPDTLPVSIEPLSAVRAIGALEQAGQTHGAYTAYAAAVERWPEDLIARMGLGNTAYALGDKPSAMQAFLAAVRAHPGSAAAHNNLAVTLQETGCVQAAREAARRAVALDEEGKEYVQTLDEIERSPVGGSDPMYCPVIVVPSS